MQESLSLLSRAFFSLVRDLVRADSDSLGGQTAMPVTTPFSTITQSDWAAAVALWRECGRELIPTLPTRNCPACGAGQHRYLFDSYDGFPFVECDGCRCWYVPLKVDEALFERFFAGSPEAREVAQRAFGKRASAENLKLDLERIGWYLDTLLPLLPPGGSLPPRYLDVGCGLGSSLLAARERGMEAVGVDASAESVSIARQQGLDVRHVSAGMPPGPFEVVSFWESLEHMDSPFEALANSLPLLDEDGLVAFTVPNQNSAPVRAMREDCSVVNGGFDTPGHINLFRPSTLHILLDRVGLTLLDIDGQYGTNLPELLSYLLGHNRGAADLLLGQALDSKVHAAALSVISSIGPAVAVLERLSRMTPILFGIACVKGREARFAEAVERLRARRKTEIVSYVDSVLGTQTNYLEHIAALEREVALRDEMLGKLQQQLNQLSARSRRGANKR